MDETYRRLGMEHRADLEREALKWQRGADVRRRRRLMLWQNLRRWFGKAQPVSAAADESSPHGATLLQPGER